MSTKPLERSLLFSVGLLAFAAGRAPAQTPRALTRDSAKPERTEILRTDDPIEPAPTWQGGGLLGLKAGRTSQPIVWTIDADGAKDEIPFSIPGAGEIIVWTLARSSDGTIALGGAAVGRDSQGSGFLGIIPPDRSKTIVVRTSPYTPEAVTIAPDGVIWAVGPYHDRVRSRRTDNVLDRFDRSGKLLSSVNMKVKGGSSGTDDITFNSRLRVSGDRVGWFTGAFEYIEFSFDGSEMQRFPAPPWNVKNQTFATMAIDSQNHVLVASKVPAKTLWELDRIKGTWFPIQMPTSDPNGSPVVFGFDGNDLVIGSAMTGFNRIARYTLPAPPSQ